MSEMDQEDKAILDALCLLAIGYDVGQEADYEAARQLVARRGKLVRGSFEQILEHQEYLRLKHKYNP